ncbi:NADH-dependent [FeFe] hydrogenase, group A6 [Sinanaerobacter chloroacetimidivorans]|jgi:NADP-reducing hydrogenase subunit HndD|uniref:[FeFe] hydrogenase, group A n=1 Tax=Sinanaerobacter chloroacetimidivorans TaxID=2818044 RepID=A0A8J8B324_9FIRM|nr:NADH-dependent [FeFe] hydrogenase, group A6 [Sinanaerobacter chloroacetimidivorans]MBR0599336.1 [FeFe] hydrogenase, group A [Sinanaerobacter chloroacetimidivorans]
MINLTINNKRITAEEGTTILEAAKQNNILIPSLCYLEGVHKIGSCRICVVEQEGAKNLQASCMTAVSEGMVIHTNSDRVRKARKILYELMLSDHPKDCLKCSRSQNCELQKLGELIQVDESRFEGAKSKDFIDETSPSIARDNSKCILCKRCVTICNEVQGVGILNPQFRGFSTEVSPGSELPLGSAACTYCGQCTTVCPVGALKEKDSTKAVWEALLHTNKTVIVQTAPAIRVALGEEFGYEPGTIVTGKMVSALKEMNFDYVFDTNFTADLTIMEEGTEFLGRIVSYLYSQKVIDTEKLEKLGFKPTDTGPTLPMITSCSPGWIKYIEHYYPEQIEHLSSCKSPHMMLGALCKSYFAEKIQVDPKDVFVVSVMPCTAKKFEITRPEMINNGVSNVDAVLTTRELAKMIKNSGIEFVSLPEGVMDHPLGLSSGAADIFGAPGGVMEAALRTVYEIVTGRELPFDKLHVVPIQGLERIKTAELTIEDAKEEWEFLNGITVKVATTSGLKGASLLMEEIQRGESPYHFIEVMGCPGGCISGGGQPRPTNDEVRKKRIQAIYAEDEGKALRKSHENPYIENLYQEYLGKPLGHRSHELLHTHYTKRSKV